MQKYEGRCKIIFADQKVNVAAARDVYARVKQPKKKGASETLIWKSSGPMGQSSRLRLDLGQEEEGRGVDGRPHEGLRTRGCRVSVFMWRRNNGGKQTLQ